MFGLTSLAHSTVKRRNSKSRMIVTDTMRMPGLKTYWMQSFESLDFRPLLLPDTIVNETLETLHKTVDISVFSNFKRHKIEEVLTHVGISLDHFNHILSGDDIVERKPGLAGFHRMIELSSCPADEILYVGDRVDVDIKPAQSLGMRTCLVYGMSDVPDHCTENFGELTDIVNQYSK